MASASEARIRELEEELRRLKIGAKNATAPAKVEDGKENKNDCPGGYYRYPVLCGDLLVFLAQDMLHVARLDSIATVPPVPIEGTHMASHPSISPDGKTLVFTVTNASDVQEVFALPLCSGYESSSSSLLYCEGKLQLTHLGADETGIAGWGITPSSSSSSSPPSSSSSSKSSAYNLYLRSLARAARPGTTQIFRSGGPRWSLSGKATGGRHLVGQAQDGGELEEMPIIDADCILTDKHSGQIIGMGRHTEDAHMKEWRGYGGGRLGELYLLNSASMKMMNWGEEIPSGATSAADAAVQREALTPFRRVFSDYHISCPMVFYGRKDHDGDNGEKRTTATDTPPIVLFVATRSSMPDFANLYAGDWGGRKLVMLTEHKKFHVRQASIDPSSGRVVYNCGPDLFLLDIGSVLRQAKVLLTSHVRGESRSKETTIMTYLTDTSIAPPSPSASSPPAAVRMGGGNDALALTPTTPTTPSSPLRFASSGVLGVSKGLSPWRLHQPAEHIEDVAIHPRGHAIAMIIRGTLWEMAPFGGPAVEVGVEGVRYKMLTYTTDGGMIAAFADRGDPDAVYIEFHAAGLFARNELGHPNPYPESLLRRHASSPQLAKFIRGGRGGRRSCSHINGNDEDAKTPPHISANWYEAGPMALRPWAVKLPSSFGVPEEMEHSPLPNANLLLLTDHTQRLWAVRYDHPPKGGDGLRHVAGDSGDEDDDGDDRHKRSKKKHQKAKKLSEKELRALANEMMRVQIPKHGEEGGEEDRAAADSGSKKEGEGRNEGKSCKLLMLKAKAIVIDSCKNEGGISDLEFSPCGSYVAYTFATSPSSSVIKIAKIYPHIRTNSGVEVTKARSFADSCPSWDPDGRYLYFLSSRAFYPADDAMLPNSIGFRAAKIPMLVSLRDARSMPSPFLMYKGHRREGYGYDDDESSDDDEDEDDEEESESDDDGQSSYSSHGLRIDMKGICDRVRAIPGANLGRYERIYGLRGGNVMYIKRRVGMGVCVDAAGGYDSDDSDGAPEGGKLMRMNIVTAHETRVSCGDVVDLRISQGNRRCMVVLCDDDQVRVEPTPCEDGNKNHGDDDDEDEDEDDNEGGGGGGEHGDDDDDDDDDEPDSDDDDLAYAARMRRIGGVAGARGRGGVYVNSRVRITVSPLIEWRQMLGEVFRTVRQLYWLRFTHTNTCDTVARRRNRKGGGDGKTESSSSSSSSASSFPLAAFQERLIASNFRQPMLQMYMQEVLPRVRCKREWVDLLENMMNNLPNSHVDVISAGIPDGTAEAPPQLATTTAKQGLLGGTFKWDDAKHGYRVMSVVRGDEWSDKVGGPLTRLGLDVRKGDLIVSLNRKLLWGEGKRGGFSRMLAGCAGREVLLTVVEKDPSYECLEYHISSDLPKGQRRGGKITSDDDSSSFGMMELSGNDNAPSKSKLSKSQRKRLKKKKAKMAAKAAEEEGKSSAAISKSGNGGGVAQRSVMSESKRFIHLHKTKERMRTVRVQCVSSEEDIDIRYRDWVRLATQHVHTESAGKLGYVHVSEMEKKGFADFIRSYSVESERDGIILDLRGNAGGNCSPLMLDALSRKALGVHMPRHGHATSFPPQLPGRRQVIVALINEDTCSDGEGLAHSLKELKIATIMGTRTWGGVIVTADSVELVDGTSIGLPTEGFYLKGAALGLENFGVSPHIVVEDPPFLVTTPKRKGGVKPSMREGASLTGYGPPRGPSQDPQLSAAIGEAMSQLVAKTNKKNERRENEKVEIDDFASLETAAIGSSRQQHEK